MRAEGFGKAVFGAEEIDGAGLPVIRPKIAVVARTSGGNPLYARAAQAAISPRPGLMGEQLRQRPRPVILDGGLPDVRSAGAANIL